MHCGSVDVVSVSASQMAYGYSWIERLVPKHL